MAFADVWAHLRSRRWAASSPTTGARWAQYVCMRSTGALPRAPVRCVDRPCLASHKARKRALLLCQLRPRAIGAWTAPPAIASLHSSLSREEDGQRPPGGLFPQLAGGGFASPGPPPNRQAAVGGLPPLVVVGGLTFLEDTHRHFSRLAPKGAAERVSSSVLCVSCRLSLGGGLKPSYSRSSSLRCPVSPLKGRPGQLALLLSHWGRLCLPQTPTQSSDPVPGSSSTGCSRRLYVRKVRSSVSSLVSPLKGRPRELPSSVLASLAASRCCPALSFPG